MKIVCVELQLCKKVTVNTVDHHRDSFYRDIKQSGKKIISLTRELNDKTVVKLKECNVQSFWVKRDHQLWLSPPEARRRNLTLLKTKTVKLPVKLTVENLAGALTAAQLESFLSRIADLKIPPHRKFKLQLLIERAKNLFPYVDNFKQQILALETSEDRQETVKLLKLPPEQIEPVNFPRELQRGFAVEYLDYLEKILDLQLQTANLIFKIEPALLDELF